MYKDTDSKLAGYLSDGIKALSYRWDRSYTITSPASETFIVAPDITQNDEHPIILAASIIYKGSMMAGSFSDGDFAFNPTQGANSSLQLDLNELKSMLPTVRLAPAISAPLRGYDTIFSPEGYNYLMGWINTL
jgi:hypothetical protein